MFTTFLIAPRTLFREWLGRVFLVACYACSLQSMAQDKAVLKDLQSKSPETQLAAFDKIVGQEEKYLDALIKLLPSKDPEVANKAALSIGTIGPKALKAAPALIENMNDFQRVTGQNEVVWYTNGKALVAIGKGVVPLLVKAAEKANPGQFMGICSTLHDLGPDAAPAVDVMIAKAKDKQLRWACLYTLEAIGKPAAKAMPLLLDSLEDENFQVQVIACRVIAAIGPEAKQAKPILFKLVKDGLPSVQGRAAIALAGIGYDEGGKEELLSLLTGLLQDRNQVMRERAVVAIGMLGKNAMPLLELVRQAANNPRFAARSEAALAIYQITGDAKEPTTIIISLLDLLDHELPAMHAAGEIGPAAIESLPKILEKMDNEDPSYAIEGCEAIERFGKSAATAIPKLRELEGNIDPEVRLAAKAALQSVQGK